MKRLTKLFESITIGTMHLKNRLAFGEVCTLGDEEGYMTQSTIDFYVERAKGGAGLIMVGAACPDIAGAFCKRIGRLDDDRYIPRLAEMTRAIHEASPNVKVGIEILHVGRQMHLDAPGAMPGVSPVAPSAVDYRWGIVPHELTIDECEQLIDRFAQAARRCRDADFDCVCIHAAHGYLVSQFLSPYTNKREDKYGGTVENRARFACEIIEGIKKLNGEDFPVLIKINGEDFVHADEQITIEETILLAPLLEKAGVDELHISGGQHESYLPNTIGLYCIPKGAFVDHASEVKKVVQVPVGAINRINDPVFAEQILAEGKADLIWMTRALIADPELPNKASEGRFEEIRTCIACNNCVHILQDKWFGDYKCAINPEATRERELQITRTLRRKDVLVIGGGPAGLEGARVAALIGHDVTLWEKESRLGGQVNLAAMPPGKEEFANLVRYFSSQMKSVGVKVELEKEATLALVQEKRPDAVIIATGSSSLTPAIPGIEKGIVSYGRDVIAGKAEVSNTVVVLGGGEVGMETAQLLAAQGKKVILVEQYAKMGTGMIRQAYHWVRGQLTANDAETLTSTKVEEIVDNGVIVVDQDDNRRLIEADSVVVAAGAKSERALLGALEGKVPELYLVGDCMYPGNIMSAIYQGTMVARMLC